MLSYPTIGFTKLNPKAVARMCSTKKVVPRNLAKFIGKYLPESLSNNVSVFRLIISIIK